MLELNFTTLQKKAKPLKRGGMEDAEEQGTQAEGGRRRCKSVGVVGEELRKAAIPRG